MIYLGLSRATFFLGQVRVGLRLHFGLLILAYFGTSLTNFSAKSAIIFFGLGSATKNSVQVGLGRATQNLAWVGLWLDPALNVLIYNIK